MCKGECPLVFTGLTVHRATHPIAGAAAPDGFLEGGSGVTSGHPQSAKGVYFTGTISIVTSDTFSVVPCFNGTF